MSKKLITAVAAATLGAAAMSAPVMAEVSATAGLVSDYYWRGAQQLSLGANANASVDYAHDSGFSAGVWAIDLGFNQGLEYDLYAAYGFEVNDDVSLSIGYTTYQFTESTISLNEVNLGASFGDFSLAVDIGNVEDSADSTVDFDTRHVALSWQANDVYSLTLGQNDPDTDADDDEWTYLEITAGGEVSGFDIAATLGGVNEGDAAGNMNGYLVLSVSKTFDGLGF